MADKSFFDSVHQRLQAASVAVDQQARQLARDLARDVLALSPGQPQAMHVLEAAARPASDSARKIARSIGGAFFLQRMEVGSVDDRMELIGQLVTGCRVLHVGCTDHPVFDPRTSLHLKIAPLASQLDGLDVDEAGLAVMKRHVPGNYFSSVDAVRAAGTTYDVLLVPETIEHVGDACAFLRGLDRLAFSRWMVTGPCVYGGFNNPTVSMRSGDEEIGPYAAIMQEGVIIEEVHPDHKYWFTPYTLANLIESSVPWTIEEAWLMNQRRQVGLIGRR